MFRHALTRLRVADTKEVELYNTQVDLKDRIPRDRVFVLEVSTDGGRNWSLLITKGGITVHQRKNETIEVDVLLPIASDIDVMGDIVHAKPEEIVAAFK